MCLILNKYTKKKFTFWPIVVYKCVRISSDGIMITPYQKMDVNFNKTYYSELKKTEEYNLTPSKCSLVINEGLHSFKYKNDAKMIAYNNYKVVKCIIPAFSYYYKGVATNIYCTSYASNKIKYIKFI